MSWVTGDTITKQGLVRDGGVTMETGAGTSGERGSALRPETVLSDGHLGICRRPCSPRPQHLGLCRSPPRATHGVNSAAGVAPGW